MYRHYFWCAFGNIPIVAVSFLTQSTKCCVTCGTIEKYVL